MNKEMEKIYKKIMNNKYSITIGNNNLNNDNIDLDFSDEIKNLKSIDKERLGMSFISKQDYKELLSA